MKYLKYSLLVVMIAVMVFMGYYAVNYPEVIYVKENDEFYLHNNFLYSLKSKDDVVETSSMNVYKINADKLTDKTEAKLYALGNIPIKDVEIISIPDNLTLIPSGQSIGVKLETKGVLVVGMEEINDENGNSKIPAEIAGLKIGDILVSINNIEVENSEHVSDLINEKLGEPIDVVISRHGEYKSFTILPIKSIDYNSYKIGLWVKDSTAGVGTMTFVEPNSREYGALGHAISDYETGERLPVKDGEVLKTKITSIKQGKKGEAGELKGIFLEQEETLGNIMNNSPYGVFGTINMKSMSNFNLDNALEIGLRYEVEEGPAQIYTTLDDNETKKFDIEIEKVNVQSTQETKSMIINITDPKLLEKSGGIVQGMSGSPIIQNNKIIGAVTHVFVNDPTKGYGIFIEWMLEETGIN